MSKPPTVSILCVTFNHEKFIAKALDSFLMQKTKFPVEIIVHDDASTDRTPTIIRKYAKKHPNIKPLLETENQYSQGNDIFVHDMFRMAQGKYIAECEGDDFWTSPDKLQKQVDFLEKNPGYSICFHPVKVFFQNNEDKEHIYPNPDGPRIFTTDELLKSNFIQSNSVMYRKQNYEHIPKNVIPLDWYMHLYHAQFGKIGFIDEVMSAYRRHPGGLWWESYADKGALWKKFGMAHLRTYTELLKLYGKNPDYKKILHQAISNALQAFIETGNERLLKEVMSIYPEEIKRYIVDHYRQLQRKSRSSEKKDQELAELHSYLEQKEEQIQELQEELAAIKNSRVWKTRNKVAKLVRRKVI